MSTDEPRRGIIVLADSTATVLLVLPPGDESTPRDLAELLADRIGPGCEVVTL